MPSLNGRTKLRSLAKVATEIQDADLLLFRGKGAISRWIRSWTRGLHSHAAKASWAKGALECVEVREFVGGRIVTLASQVALYPGQIDVLRANGDGLPERRTSDAIADGLKPGQFYDRTAADQMMRSFAGTEYGYWTVIVAGVTHLPVIRLFLVADFDDEAAWAIPDCSAACAIADRLGGGYDPVRHLSDAQTSPAELARSPFYRYLFTLTP
jgi:hypothetical protein